MDRLFSLSLFSNLRRLRSFLQAAFCAVLGAAVLLTIADQIQIAAKSPDRLPVPEEEIRLLTARHFQPSPAPEPEMVYVEAIDRRNLFGLARGEAGETAGVALSEQVRDFRLKGVAFFDEPVAILEDARTQVSVFLKKGEKTGGVSVAAIAEDTVTLTDGASEAVLRIQGGGIE